MEMPSGKGYVLITGASTGIGRACVEYLAGRGFEVLAGVRRVEDGELLKRVGVEKGGVVSHVLLDVTHAESVAAAARTVGEIVGSSGLRGLVNNAGVGIPGPVEFVGIEEWRRQFEVNFFGHVAVTQAMLPLLRDYGAGHKESARIVMMGSIAGRISQPILVPYCASKYALRALADGLRNELRGQRVETSLVEPGFIQSEIGKKGKDTMAAFGADSPARQRYGGMMAGIVRAVERAQASALPAVRVAEVVERCLVDHRAPTRVLVGRDAKLGAFARACLPDRWFDALIRRTM